MTIVRALNAVTFERILEFVNTELWSNYNRSKAVDWHTIRCCEALVAVNGNAETDGTRGVTSSYALTCMHRTARFYRLLASTHACQHRTRDRVYCSL
jgi:hypothetical protein